MTGQGTVVSGVAGDRGHIVFAADAFAAAAPARVRYTDLWETVEYALFRGQGAQAEVAYITAIEADVALTYDDTVTQSVARWNLNRGRTRAWGAVGRVHAPYATYYYRPYTLAGTERRCVGFSATRDDQTDDFFARPATALFGYYCAPEGTELTRRVMESLIAGIAIRDDAGRAAPPLGTAAMRVALGPEAAADRGARDFPFHFARQYWTGKGG